MATSNYALYSPCAQSVEDSFGPIVPGSCEGGFDFTLLFEETLFTIVPTVLAVVWAAVCVPPLFREQTKSQRAWLLSSKLFAYAVFISLHLAFVVTWSTSGIPKTRVLVASEIVLLVGFTLLAFVSYFEHLRSLRPSNILTVFLGITLLLDAARVRTLFSQTTPTIAGLYAACFATKTVLLVFELWEKRQLLLPAWIAASLEDTSSIYNRALFVWLNGLFVDGFRRVLSVDALLDLDQEILQASRAQKLIDQWEKVSPNAKDHSLLWVFLKHYKWSLFAGVIPRLAYIGFTFAQPFLVQTILDYTDVPYEDRNHNIGYTLIGASALIYIGIAISFALYQHMTYRLLTKFRGTLVNLIFSKTLTVGKSSISRAEAITLMSADIDRIGLSLQLFHETYASIISLGLSLWLLYRLLGVSMVASTAWTVAVMALGMPIAVLAGNAQVPWLEAIETRLSTTADSLGAIKSSKMVGIIGTMAAKMADLRAQEIRASRAYRFWAMLLTTASYLSSTFAPVWGFGLYSILADARNSGTLTNSIAFAALTLYDLQDQPAVTLLNGLEDIQILVNCFGRIQSYLTSNERRDARIIASPESRPSFQSEKHVKPRLACNGIEKDLVMPLRDPSIAIKVRDLSVGYDADKGHVIKSLSFDVAHGDIIMVAGPVGSGKTALIRAMLGEMPAMTGTISTSFRNVGYCSQSPWIVWGSIQKNIVGASEWDPEWYSTVVDACQLSSDLHELQDGDKTEAGAAGSRLSGGQQVRVALARAIYSKRRCLVLDDVLTGLDLTTERAILDSFFGANGLVKRMGTTVVLATNAAAHLRYADKVIVLDAKGAMARMGTWEEVMPAIESVETTTVDGKGSSPDAQDEAKEWENAMQDLGVPLNEIPSNKNRQTGDLKVYLYYIRTAGYRLMAWYLLAAVMYIFGITFPSIWIQWWTDANVSSPNANLGYWISIYAVFGLIALLGTFLSEATFMMLIVPRTSAKFHEYLLTATTRAATSFLTSTNIGTITNRFSQDLELIDNDLPESFDLFVLNLLSVVSSGVLICIGSSYLAAVIPLCLAVIWVIQSFYLRTSRQLRLLDIEAKAPLFSQFLEALDSVESIRAYGWTETYMKQHYEALDRSQKPYYLLWCIQRWLALVLDLFVAALAILLVGLATSINAGQTGFLGVALINIVSFSSSLQNLVKDWTQLETAVGAVSRIRTYVSETKPEASEGEDGSMPEDWPCSGALSMSDVSAAFEKSGHLILKDISLSINPGEKVAICGRTGSGKSSLISTILRMLELETGSIIIDDINISKIPRDEMRKRFNTISQVPVFIQGTVRQNIDPFELSNDDRIEEALRSVGLKQLLESDAGLDSEFDRSTLSHGERQLISIARALINPSRIVIMDEPTSSVDATVDQLVQKLIREKLRNRTIIAIVHKLDTVLDFDRVVVLDQGRIVEAGSPKVLLEDSDSRFRRLWMSSNPTSGAASGSSVHRPMEKVD